MKILKSVGAVVAGFLVVAVLSTVTDTILEKTGVFPSLQDSMKYGFNTPWMVWLAFIYRSLYTVFGGYLTAKLAPSHPMRHAVILGIIGTAAATAAAFATIPMHLGPIWYPIALAVTGLPLIWAGAKLTEKKKSK